MVRAKIKNFVFEKIGKQICFDTRKHGNRTTTRALIESNKFWSQETNKLTARLTAIDHNIKVGHRNG